MPSNKFKTKFPPARIKKIMQTDEEVGKVAAAVPVIVSKSLELFTEIFLQKTGAVATSRGARTLTIDHIKECVDAEHKFDFLREIVAEAAAKAVGKSGEEASSQPAVPPSHTDPATSNGVKEVSRRHSTKLDVKPPKRTVTLDLIKREKIPNPSGSSLTVPPLSLAMLSNLTPLQDSSFTSVITKVERSPVPENTVSKRRTVDANEADDEMEDTELRTKPQKQTRLHSVVEESGSRLNTTFRPGRDKDIKVPVSAKEHTARAKKLEMGKSVIVKRDVQRSQSHTESHWSPHHPSSHASIPSSAPPVIPTSMHFMYGGSTTSPMFAPMPSLTGGYPSSATTAAPRPGELFPPYTPQAMMLMMQQQQEAREALQYQLYAQHEHEQRLLEGNHRLPTTFPSPRDYYSEPPGTMSRSVIVPTAEAQDLRLNQPVDSSHGPRYPSYHNRDGSY